MIWNHQTYLNDTIKGLESICSEPVDTSFVLQQNEEEHSEKEEQHQQKERAGELDDEFSDEDVKQEVLPNKTSLKRKIVTQPHDKRNVSRSQLQALPQLAAGVNKLAKRISLEEEDKEGLLKCWWEEAAKTRHHEKEMAQLY